VLRHLEWPEKPGTYSLLKKMHGGERGGGGGWGVGVGGGGGGGGGVGCRGRRVEPGRECVFEVRRKGKRKQRAKGSHAPPGANGKLTRGSCASGVMIIGPQRSLKQRIKEEGEKKSGSGEGGWPLPRDKGERTIS